MYFRTGDLMRQDKAGYFYFVDRIGDTFRWKSENVSTADVGGALGTFDGIEEANAYGVSVPNHEGRAGMAVLVIPKPIDFDALLAHLKAQLPNYALPLFFRIRKEMETTATFKYKKVDLVREGFDPEMIDDQIYWLNPQLQKYVPMSDEDYDNIAAGKVRF